MASRDRPFNRFGRVALVTVSKRRCPCFAGVRQRVALAVVEAGVVCHLLELPKSPDAFLERWISQCAT